MRHCLLLLQGEDLAAAPLIARDLPDCETCVFDPVLIDRARAAGLPNVRLLPWPGAPAYADLHRQADAAAKALERQLDIEVSGLGDGVSIAGWQHLSLYYLFLALGWYTGMAHALVGSLKERQLHVLLCDNPAIYYFPSFIPGLLVLHQAQALGIAVSAYGYGRKPDAAGQLPRLDGRALVDGRETLLAHLPTCMYDIHHFNDELRASGKAVVAIEAKHFSMPVAAERTIPLASVGELSEPVDAAWQARVDRIAETLARRLDAHFADKIPAVAFRARQAAQLAEVYRAQLLTLQLLERHFEFALPSKLLLSDHDTGFHGPLLAWASRHHLPVLLLPHSKTTPDIEFDCPGAVVLTHPIQGEAVLDAGGRLLRQHALALPVNLSATTRMPAPVRRVALMLNALTLGGVPFADYRAYLDGIATLLAWCRDHGLSLDLRCKPSYSLVQLLSSELGLDPAVLIDSAAMTMSEFSSRCDLCLMYDTPTAGALEFLNQGIAILNPVITPLTRAQSVTTHPDVVPRESIAQTLQRLQTFVTEPAALQQFRLRQFHRYVQLFADARPLRSFL